MSHLECAYGGDCQKWVLDERIAVLKAEGRIMKECVANVAAYLGIEGQAFRDLVDGKLAALATEGDTNYAGTDTAYPDWDSRGRHR